MHIQYQIILSQSHSFSKNLFIAEGLLLLDLKHIRRNEVKYLLINSRY